MTIQKEIRTNLERADLGIVSNLTMDPGDELRVGNTAPMAFDQFTIYLYLF